MHTHKLSLSVLMFTILFAGACDEAAAPPASTREINRPVAEVALARSPASDRHDPLAGVGGDELYIDVPTVRDVVEGRVQAPIVSSAFAMIEDDECPQERAAREGTLADLPAAETVAVASDDPAFLDMPLSDACVQRADDGAHTLIPCETGSDGGLAPNTFSLTAATDPSGDLYRCYFCNSGFPCFTKRYQEGYVNQFYQCITWGYNGCC